MGEVLIRELRKEDAEVVSDLIRRNLLEVNTRDYPVEKMEETAGYCVPEELVKLAGKRDMFVAESKSLIVRAWADGVPGQGAV